MRHVEPGRETAIQRLPEGPWRAFVVLKWAERDLGTNPVRAGKPPEVELQGRKRGRVLKCSAVSVGMTD